MTGFIDLIKAIRCLFGIKETETNKDSYKRPIHYLNEAIIKNGNAVPEEEVTDEYKRPVYYLYKALEEQNAKAA